MPAAVYMETELTFLAYTMKMHNFPDHGSQAAIMAKFRAFMLNPDLFLTTFLLLFRTFSRYAR